MREHFLGTDYELQLLLLSLLLGGILGTVYDFWRGLRRAARHNAIAVGAQDFGFVILFALCFYSLCVSLCGGALRGFLLVGMLMGFAVEIYTVGRIISDFFNLTISAGLKLLKYSAGRVRKALNSEKSRKKVKTPLEIADADVV